MAKATPKEDKMGKRGPKGFTDTKIVGVLRAVEAAVAQGDTVKEAGRKEDEEITVKLESLGRMENPLNKLTGQIMGDQTNILILMSTIIFQIQHGELQNMVKLDR